MVTEDDARTLLARAADTVPVADPAEAHLVRMPSRRVITRRLGAAGVVAAVVALIVVGGLFVGGQGGDGAPPPPTSDRSGEPVEQEHVYGLDQVPPLLGYRGREAAALIDSRGAEAQLVHRYSCTHPRGYVIDTAPAQAARLRPGATVGVRVSAGQPPAARCVETPERTSRAIELIRFARGIGPAPAFADDVHLYAGTGEPVRLTAAEAADPDAWVLCAEGECHSALAALEEMVTRPWPAGSGFLSPSLVVARWGPDRCPLTPDPYEHGLRRTAPTTIHVATSIDGVGICPHTPVVQVEGTGGEIGVVGIRWPEGQEEAEDSGSPDPDRAAAAEAFVAWARGEGPPPEFAEEVRLLDADLLWDTLSDEEARDEPRWAMCSGRAPDACAVDARKVVDRHDGPVVQTGERASMCVERFGDLPADLAAAVDTDLVRLDQPEPRGCRDAWAVELWIDGEGQIYAANLAAAPRRH